MIKISFFKENIVKTMLGLMGQKQTGMIGQYVQTPFK